jgi:hypothetical protein
MLEMKVSENEGLDLTALLFGEETENEISCNLAKLLDADNCNPMLEEMTSLDITCSDKCPICNHKIRKAYEDFIDHTVCEYNYVCDRCGLNTSYAYGRYQTWIEDFMWESSYLSRPSQEEREKESRQQKLVLNLFRKIHVDNESLTEAEEKQLDDLARELRGEDESNAEMLLANF